MLITSIKLLNVYKLKFFSLLCVHPYSKLYACRCWEQFFLFALLSNYLIFGAKYVTSRWRIFLVYPMWDTALQAAMYIASSVETTLALLCISQQWESQC